MSQSPIAAPSPQPASPTPARHENSVRSGVTGGSNDVGQIILTLGIVVADPVEQAEQLTPVDGHNTGIAQADGALLGVGVAEFDDA